ncbi:hypothetical protein GGI05_000883, partial [Coemansia sp. RSA 2603]
PRLMDERTCNVRKDFLSLLVRMSTCTVDCLSYDTSIWYDENHKVWVANVFDDSTGDVSRCTIDRLICSADGTFRRHWRMFGSIGTLYEIENRMTNSECAFVIKAT